MKKIYLALLALTLGVSAQAQRKLDLDFQLQSPIIDTNLKPGANVYYKYVITNNSLTTADSLMVGDTIQVLDPYCLNTADTFRQYRKLGVPSTIPKGGTLTVSGSGKVDDIKTLVTLSNKIATTFTKNTQYEWFIYLAGISFKTTGPTVTALSGDGDTNRVWYNKTPVGIDEISFEGPSIKTFPNPAANQLSFEYNFETSEKATATIMDAAGRTVLVREFENNNIGNQRLDLDIISISNGMYFLKLNVGEKSSTTKFNVQK